MGQDKDLLQPWGKVTACCTKPSDTHQPCTVVTREVLIADLYQAPKGLLKNKNKEGGGLRNGERAPPSPL